MHLLFPRHAPYLLVSQQGFRVDRVLALQLVIRDINALTKRLVLPKIVIEGVSW